MGYFDYSKDPRSDIAFVDMKSFYASVECVERGLHLLCYLRLMRLKVLLELSQEVN